MIAIVLKTIVASNGLPALGVGVKVKYKKLHNGLAEVEVNKRTKILCSTEYLQNIEALEVYDKWKARIQDMDKVDFGSIVLTKSVVDEFLTDFKTLNQRV